MQYRHVSNLNILTRNAALLPYVVPHKRKSHNAPVLYPTMLHSDQKYANICSEWSFVGYWTVAFRDLWTTGRSILPIFSGCFRWQCDRFSVSQWSHTENMWKWTGSTAVTLITKTKIYTKTNVSWGVLHVEGLVQDCNFLHARPWIPGDEIAIFTAIIH